MKRLACIATAAALALTISSAPVHAASKKKIAAANRTDAQCLALFLTRYGGESKVDQDAKMGGVIVVGYYIGKIETRSPGIDLEPLLTDVLLNDFGNRAAPEAIVTRCTAEAVALGDRLVTAGKNMTKAKP